MEVQEIALCFVDNDRYSRYISLEETGFINKVTFNRTAYAVPDGFSGLVGN
jgi:hypothetical protein